MKHLLAFLVALCCWASAWASKKNEPVVVAYVTSWTDVMPDPLVMTHINYAFGHVNEQFDGVRIDNVERLQSIVALKHQQSSLRVMLSIGGWGSGRFSEMAARDDLRRAFAKDCRRLCDELNLDGIDIDWEYPTQNSAGISASPDDTENFTLLMRDLRQALGSRLWLTLASVGSAQFIDFRTCQQYLDLVNVMAYDMGNAPKHHAALFRSQRTGWMSSAEAVEAHRKAGVPDDKIVLGMPFYGRGTAGKYLKYKDRAAQVLPEQWDDVAKAPYLADKDGTMAFGFESPRSVATKCAFIRQQGLRGAMYWEYADDNEQGDLQRAVWQGVMQGDKDQGKSCRKAAQRLAAVLTDNQKREDITPDSFFHDYRNLKTEMLAEKNPTAQAIYRAAMAHLLCQNQWRSLGFDRQTTSHPDSIQEWSQPEYQAQAARLYAQALQDVEALHRCKVVDAKPLTAVGRDDDVFGGDLLYVVWQSALQDLNLGKRMEGLLPNYGDIIEVYRRHGLREATLQLRLDSLAEAPLQNALCDERFPSSVNVALTPSTPDSEKQVLLRLRDEYVDLDACSHVYLRLAALPDDTPQQHQDYLKEALKRYPKCRWTNELKNQLASLRHPWLSGRFHEAYYPDRDYDIPLVKKNMLSGQLAVYRVPRDFDFSDEDKAGSRAEQVKSKGTLVETLPIPMDDVDALVTGNDTLRWHTPGFGRYAIILDGTTQEKLEPHQPQVILTSVSALTFMSVSLPDNRKRVMVTDAMSGEPQQGVKVGFYSRSGREYTLLEEKTTDERGIAEREIDRKNGNLYVELSRGEDNAHGKESLGWHYVNEYTNEELHFQRLFTDRSIYRPGQTVFVGGFAFTRSHEQEPQVEAGAELTLIMYDVNNQEVAKHSLLTDEYGSIQDSIQLPEAGMPGVYRLRLGNFWHDIRVEEYRRPTFEVKMDEAPAVTLPVDSVTLTGRAMTYSQWPVARARVTGTYHWQQSWWYKRRTSGESHDIDTLYTDDEGRFSVTVPVSGALTPEQFRYGQTLVLSIDVLSPEGETQNGTCRMTLCDTSLRMTGRVPMQHNKEALGSPLSSWRFELYASNDKTVEGDVLCELSQNGREVQKFLLPAGRDTIPDVLRDLPSGQYDLVARAEIKGDTASYKTSFTIFSIADKHLVGKHDLWLFTPSNVTSPNLPARIQVGTTLPEAWIYCVMTAECGMVRDTLLHLSDEATLLEVGYEERFRHHLGVTVMLVNEGRFLQDSRTFKLEQPETKLTMRWETFRDHLQPGQKEQWRLTLTRPDGTPAAANVMVDMYDASLDAMAPYRMSAGISRVCNRNVMPGVSGFAHFSRSSYTGVGLPLHLFAVEGYDFARWNESLFQGTMPATRGGRSMRLRGMGTGQLRETAVFDMAEVKMAKASAAAPALQGQISGLNIVESSEESGEDAMRLGGISAEEEDAETAETDRSDAVVRSDLSELAFFYPQLRTDSRGQTSIEFTLPEGLTSWHLHGLAHTSDMMTAEWQETVTAEKELMAELTLPRFLRNGDDVTLTASIRNASQQRQRGEAVLEVRDAESNAVLKRLKVRFDLAPGKESVYEMPYKATLDHPVLAVQWLAKGKDSSDGEVRYLPVLSDMQNMTETRTYLLRGDTTLTMNLSNLFGGKKQGARGKTLTIEHVSEPIYLALQALPSLTAPVRNDILSVASAYYGGSVACHIARTCPNVRETIAAWAKDDSSPSMESPLVRNQQLADILLNETPWVAEAQQQKAARQRLSSLFDEMSQEQRRMTMLSALSVRQNSDGSFGWFPGMNGSVWMTSQVAVLLARLGAIQDGWSVPERQILDKAMSYLDQEMHKEVEALRKEKTPVLSLSHLRYLYIYIMYRENPGNDANYLLSLLKKQAEDLDREQRALAAIVLKRAGEEKKAKALMPRLHELLRQADGMYLAYPGGSFTSIDRKVQTHVNMMEAVGTVEPKETDLYAKMAEWLIQQKRTQEWEQPVQSADAIYALTAHFPIPSPEGDEGSGAWRGTVTYDNQTRQLAAGDAMPYVRERIESLDHAIGLRIEQHDAPRTATSEKQGRNLSWGAVYAQYQLPATEVESLREGLTIRREVNKTPAGTYAVGDRVNIRYTITADRDYEYICLRAPRPASAEPDRQISAYRWQGGLGYYQAMHDASTEYYMDRLPRGTYVVEEDWLLTRSGNFLLPPARLTCLYAPEYQSNTAGEKFGVK